MLPEPADCKQPDTSTLDAPETEKSATEGVPHDPGITPVEPTCSFRETIRHSGIKQDVCCGRSVYKDGLCIFHIDKLTSDAGEQERRKNDFSEAINTEIEKAKSASPDFELDWRGARIPTVDLKNKIFPRPVLLTAAQFEGPLKLTNCQFFGNLNVDYTNFHGEKKNITIKTCVFHGEANFWFAKFGNNPVIEDCVFEKQVKFQHCQLTAPDFSGNRFKDGVAFPMANFSGTCDFKLCHFHGDIDFQSIIPDNDAAFDFRNSLVAGKFKFGAGEGQDTISLKRLDFSSTEINEGTSLMFMGISPAESDFQVIALREKINVSFVDSSLISTLFLNTNIEKLNFINVTWPRYGTRYGLISEAFLKEKISEFSRGSHVADTDRELLLSRVEENSENYRQLVRNHEIKRNFSMAEDFHVGEMEMQRQKGQIRGLKYSGVMRKLTSWNDFSIYKILSRYGTSYTRSLAVLSVIILLMSFLFLWTGLTKANCGTSQHSVNSSCRIGFSFIVPAGGGTIAPAEWLKEYSSALLFTLGVATLQKDTLYKTDTYWGELLRIFTILLVPGQAALTLLAVRRRFRRAGGGD